MIPDNYDILCAYDNLAKAVVYQAIKDYKKAYKDYLKNETKSTRCRVVALRRFFTSKWYGILFDYDGKALIELIENNCKARKSMKKHFKLK